jgi:hypothetical protein
MREEQVRRESKRHGIDTEPSGPLTDEEAMKLVIMDTLKIANRGAFTEFLRAKVEPPSPMALLKSIEQRVFPTLDKFFACEIKQADLQWQALQAGQEAAKAWLAASK